MFRIHVVGIAPRTGTTLMAQCIQNCFKISASESHEASLFNCRWVDGVFLTKQPYDLRKVQLRMKLDRRLHVICMVRDPRDVVTSVHSNRQSEYFTELNVWKANNRIISRISHLGNFTAIRYEDLVSDPDAVQAKIQQRMPFLSKTRDFSQWHVGTIVSEKASLALNGVRPISKSEPFRWRKHAGRIHQQISAHGPMSDELIAWDYEKDKLWVNELNRDQAETTAFASAPQSKSWRKSKMQRRMRNARYFISAVICGICDKLGINYG